jgi:hypothetical protein
VKNEVHVDWSFISVVLYLLAFSIAGILASKYFDKMDV